MAAYDDERARRARERTREQELARAVAIVRLDLIRELTLLDDDLIITQAKMVNDRVPGDRDEATMAAYAEVLAQPYPQFAKDILQQS